MQTRPISHILFSVIRSRTLLSFAFFIAFAASTWWFYSLQSLVNAHLADLHLTFVLFLYFFSALITVLSRYLVLNENLPRTSKTRSLTHHELMYSPYVLNSIHDWLRKGAFGFDGWTTLILSFFLSPFSHLTFLYLNYSMLCFSVLFWSIQTSVCALALCEWFAVLLLFVSLDHAALLLFCLSSSQPYHIHSSQSFKSYKSSHAPNSFTHAGFLGIFIGLWGYAIMAQFAASSSSSLSSVLDHSLSISISNPLSISIPTLVATLSTLLLIECLEFSSTDLSFGPSFLHAVSFMQFKQLGFHSCFVFTAGLCCYHAFNPRI